MDARSAASASDVTTVDHVRSYCGMRKTSLGRDRQGTLRLMLNNEFIFQVSHSGGLLPLELALCCPAT